MLKVNCTLRSITPMTFNKKLRSEKGPNETHDEFEKKIWRERCDCNKQGNLILRSDRFKKSIALGAKWLNMKIPGEGQATYTKHFKGGLIVMNHIDLKVTPEEVDHALIYTSPRPKDGKRWIHFPTIENWEGELDINILDEKITEEIFTKVINYAGMAIGVGSWRPENGGENGRYEVTDISVKTI